MNLRGDNKRRNFGGPTRSRLIQTSTLQIICKLLVCGGPRKHSLRFTNSSTMDQFVSLLPCFCTYNHIATTFLREFRYLFRIWKTDKLKAGKEIKRYLDYGFGHVANVGSGQTSEEKNMSQNIIRLLFGSTCYPTVDLFNRRG